jgi:hypothetical protein
MDLPLITDLRHPIYEDNIDDWIKFRLTYKGGRQFIEQYTQRFSTRESDTDFVARKRMTHCPAFAKAAINDIKNSIFQRVTDITRKDGLSSYINAINGLDGGVDRRGSSMNDFIGRNVLPDLLALGKVGVFVDRPEISGETQQDAIGKHPYVYTYPVERILCWKESPHSISDFTSVLLEDNIEVQYENTGLTFGCRKRVRHMWLDENGFVKVQFYFGEGKDAGTAEGPPTTLRLRKIPFVVFELTESLLMDVADYQISLLNMSSSDVAYALKSNFPFYVEQADLRESLSHLIQRGEGTGTGTGANTAGDNVVETGTVSGRRYPKGNNQPAFINPSAEPLRVSMEKQEQLKEEIRLLVNLSLSNIRPKMASADSKAMDNQGLESGLSYIGLELQHGERQIAEHWAAYEGSDDVATILYPEKYDLKSDAERRADAESLSEISSNVPSKTFQKEIKKEIARIVIGPKVPYSVLESVMQEIDNAPAVLSDPDIISQAVEGGYLSKSLAGDLMNFPEGEADRAADEKHEATLQLAEAQAVKQGPATVGSEDGTVAGLKNPAARGVPELSADPKADAKAEKKDKPRRGRGK